MAELLSHIVVLALRFFGNVTALLEDLVEADWMLTNGLLTSEGWLKARRATLQLAASRRPTRAAVLH